MSYPSIVSGIEVVGVFDPRHPNQERVVLKPRYRLSLAGYGVAVGIEAPNGGAFPLQDHVFWFPEFVVEPPSWIFLYTGRGTPRQTQMPNGEPALTFHWNRAVTLFNSPQLVAVVFTAALAEIGKQWPAAQQLGRGAP